MPLEPLCALLRSEGLAHLQPVELRLVVHGKSERLAGGVIARGDDTSQYCSKLSTHWRGKDCKKNQSLNRLAACQAEPDRRAHSAS